MDHDYYVDGSMSSPVNSVLLYFLLVAGGPTSFAPWNLGQEPVRRGVQNGQGGYGEKAFSGSLDINAHF